MSVRSVIRVTTACVVAAAFHVAALAAQEPQSQFVPADTLPQETLPATPLVFAAYAFAWLALIVYVFALWRRLGRVERELQDVRNRQARRQG